VFQPVLLSPLLLPTGKESVSPEVPVTTQVVLEVVVVTPVIVLVLLVPELPPINV